jgi:hypothetical protein
MRRPMTHRSPAFPPPEISVDPAGCARSRPSLNFQQTSHCYFMAPRVSSAAQWNYYYGKCFSTDALLQLLSWNYIFIRARRVEIAMGTFSTTAPKQN